MRLKVVLYVTNRIRKGTVEEINAMRWKTRARLTRSVSAVHNVKKMNDF